MAAAGFDFCVQPIVSIDAQLAVECPRNHDLSSGGNRSLHSKTISLGFVAFRNRTEPLPPAGRLPPFAVRLLPGRSYPEDNAPGPDVSFRKPLKRRGLGAQLRRFICPAHPVQQGCMLFENCSQQRAVFGLHIG